MRVEELQDYIRSRRSRRAKASGALLSFPKSGRTWLGYMYAYYAVHSLLGSDADRFIEERLTPGAHTYRPHEYPGFLELVERSGEGRVPTIAFAHGFPADPYYQLELDLRGVRADAALLLARDPRDVVVSYFHHTMQRAKTRENARRPAPDVDLPEFLRSECFGIRAVIAYMNQVAERAPGGFERFAVIHYEDFVADPVDTLGRFLAFFGVARLDDVAIERAVERASFDALQRLEIARRTRKSRDEPDPDALRFRRGVVGSFRDELGESDVAYLDRVIEAHLAPAFERYRRPAAVSAE